MSAREEGLFVPVWVLHHPSVGLSTRYVLAVVIGLRPVLERGELTKVQLAKVLRMSDRTLSYHIRKLKGAGIVRLVGTQRRPARWEFTLAEARKVSRKSSRES